jgi:hypothetical protein
MSLLRVVNAAIGTFNVLKDLFLRAYAEHATGLLHSRLDGRRSFHSRATRGTRQTVSAHLEGTVSVVGPARPMLRLDRSLEFGFWTDRSRRAGRANGQRSAGIVIGIDIARAPAVL